MTGVASVIGSASTITPPSRRIRLAALPLGHDIDPYRDAEPGVDELAWLYGDGLVGWRAGPIPLLAENLPDAVEHGRVYHYTLREVRWHDGRPLTAHDVADALKSVRSTPWGMREPYRSVRELVVSDERHFSVVLDSPQRGFLRSFFGPYGTPALPVLRHDDRGLPIGTGPFAIRSRPDLDRWILERHLGSPRGAPSLDVLDVRLLSSDITAGVQLLSGEADIALPLAPAAAAGWRFQRVRRFTSTAVLLVNGSGVLNTVAARKALAGAIDVPRLQKRYDPRRVELLATLLMKGQNDDRLTHALAYDPAALTVLRRSVGSRQLVVTGISESIAHQRVFAQLADTFERGNVAYRIMAIPGRRYLGEGSPLRKGDFDIALDAFVYGEDPDLEADWSCTTRAPHGGNFARWCDKTADAALIRGDLAGALRRIYDSMACIPLSRAYEDIGVDSRVRGFEVPTPLIPATYGCAAWSVA